ncbi:hypothetical protein [Ilyobacter polytropus]|uniref:Uncharacterized protein n=1 Tax=Ilyobacter polytropus (strain ATCC 51220 / DSM 2926 / LMG 16218 / CuHBu1) TaxID=572544 RepID=E3HBD0_ILYPC|nr:hypothetical protein [Ilyobacter polytropus]ADO83745.1 hypothetical protein Ilyop_1974 [Ilyobacter polytropus DSM 2926]
MKTECIDSLRLEFGMNVQCQFMKAETYLLHKDDVDKKDDERRDRSFKLDKWHEDMMKYFIKSFRKSLETRDWLLVEEATRKMVTFDRDYFKTRKILQREELHFEEMDDELRMWLIGFVAECIEKIKDRSSIIDLKIITENLKSKRERWGTKH